MLLAAPVFASHDIHLMPALTPLSSSSIWQLKDDLDSLYHGAWSIKGCGLRPLSGRGEHAHCHQGRA